MKYFYKFFLPLIITFFSAGLIGCSSDNTETPVNPEEEFSKLAPMAEIVSIDAQQVAATVTIKTLNCLDVAYDIVNDAQTAPSAQLVYASGTNYAISGERDSEGYITSTFEINRILAPATDYQIAFVFKTNRNNFVVNADVDIMTNNFTTKEMGELEPGLTILKTTPYGWVAHFEMPELGEGPQRDYKDNIVTDENGEPIMLGNALRWSNSNIFTFNIKTIGAGNCDAFAMTLHDDYYPDNRLFESTTFAIGSEELMGKNDSDFKYLDIEAILPGEPHYFLTGEFQHGNSPYFSYGDGTVGWRLPLFDNASFVRDTQGSLPYGTEYNTQGEYWSGFYSRDIYTTTAPEKIEQKCKVEITNARPNDATVTITPEEGVVAYAFMVLDHSTYQQYTSVLMDPANWQWFLTSYAGLYEGALTVTQPVATRFNLLNDIFYECNPGILYHVLITSMGNEMLTKQSFMDFTFTLPDRTKPAPEVVVTPLPDECTDDTIYFNIKAPNKDAYEVKYLVGYRQQFESYLSQYSYSYLVDYYGATLPSQYVEQINSDEGFLFQTSSKPNSDTVLAVIVSNDEGLSNNPDAPGSQAVAQVRSKPLPAEPRVESEYFEALQGQWTASAQVLISVYDEEAGAAKWVKLDEPVSCDVEIFDEITYPDPMPDSVYDLYPPSQKDKADMYYEEFKTEAAQYNQQLYNNNRLLCLGFNFFLPESDGKENNYYRAMSVAEPWDLFVHETYSSASTAGLFEDFGPKWFLHVEQDGSLTVPINTESMDPLTDWVDNYTYYMIGWDNANDQYMPYDLTTGEDAKFPVVVAEDKNSFTIKGIEYDGDTYYPTAVALINNSPYIDAVVCSEITLTRKSAGEEADNSAVANSVKHLKRAGVVGNGPAITVKNNETMPRSLFIGDAPKQVEIVEMKDFRFANFDGVYERQSRLFDLMMEAKNK